MEIDAPVSGYTAAYLKAVVHHAKIYNQPLHEDLSLEPSSNPVKAHIYVLLLYLYYIEMVRST